MNIPIFLINLNSDTKRLDFMNYQFSYLKLNNLVTRIPAVDMRKSPTHQILKDPNISLFTKFTIENKHRCDHKQIDSAGAIGSTMSHYSVWKHIIDQNIDIAIVMEDDMRLMLDFPNIISNEVQKYKNKFDMINFGFQKKGFSEVNQYKFYIGAGCYAVTKRGCEILCQYAFPIEVHVDAYFFLLDHFGLFKMIMSNETAAVPQNGVQTNIDHGQLKCNDHRSDKIVIYQECNFSKKTVIIILLVLTIIAYCVFSHFHN